MKTIIISGHQSGKAIVMKSIVGEAVEGVIAVDLQQTITTVKIHNAEGEFICPHRNRPSNGHPRSPRNKGRSS